MPNYYVVKAITGRIVSRHRKEDRAKAEAIRLRVKSGITGLRVISEDERTDSEWPRRPPRPLVTGEDVVAAEDFDEFAHVSEDEMTIITVKAGDLGQLVREQSIDGTVGVVFDGRTVDLWPHQIRRAT